MRIRALKYRSYMKQGLCSLSVISRKKTTDYSASRKTEEKIPTSIGYTSRKLSFYWSEVFQSSPPRAVFAPPEDLDRKAVSAEARRWLFPASPVPVVTPTLSLRTTAGLFRRRDVNMMEAPSYSSIRLVSLSDDIPRNTRRTLVLLSVAEREILVERRNSRINLRCRFARNLDDVSVLPTDKRKVMRSYNWVCGALNRAAFSWQSSKSERTFKKGADNLRIIVRKKGLLKMNREKLANLLSKASEALNGCPSNVDNLGKLMF